MKLIKQSVEIWKQPEGEIGIYKQAERAARLCYKSCDKITEDSYKKFIGMLKSNGHNSTFEHGTVYLKIDKGQDLGKLWAVAFSPYSRSNFGVNTMYITTNYRVLLENNIVEEAFKYLCEPTKYHTKRISVYMTTSIGISRELNRHRCHSICEESSRYCNYSKDKFNNELTFIQPGWVYSDKFDRDSLEWSAAMANAERGYMSLIKNGWKPEQARDLLPLATKTELVHTAFEDDWEKFFELRCSKAAHPLMRELANLIKSKIND